MSYSGNPSQGVAESGQRGKVLEGILLVQECRQSHGACRKGTRDSCTGKGGKDERTGKKRVEDGMPILKREKMRRENEELVLRFGEGNREEITDKS